MKKSQEVPLPVMLAQPIAALGIVQNLMIALRTKGVISPIEAYAIVDSAKDRVDRVVAKGIPANSILVAAIREAIDQFAESFDPAKGQKPN